jgi:hypothetical protein
MLNKDLTKYLTINPQAFSYTMLGLSTLILAYFVGEDTVEPEKAQESSVKESKPDVEEEEDDTDDIDIEALINKKFSSTEQRGGKKSKKRKTKRRKHSRL